jgi:hypothetical protein
MIVFVAGMQRSGSTFTLNIARELLETRGRVHVDDYGAIGDIREIVKRSDNSDHVVIKGHLADDFLISLIRHRAIPVICSVRRLEEAAASWIDTFGFDFETTTVHLKQWFAMFEAVRPLALLLPYQLIDQSPTDAVRMIAEKLSLPADQSVITGLAEKYSKANVHKFAKEISKGDAGTRDLGFSFLNVRTLFHRGHVSSLTSRKPEVHLSAAQLAKLRKEFAKEIAILEPLLEVSQSVSLERQAMS